MSKEESLVEFKDICSILSASLVSRNDDDLIKLKEHTLIQNDKDLKGKIEIIITSIQEFFRCKNDYNKFKEQISKINEEYKFSKSQTRNKVAKTSSHDKPQEDDSIMIQNLIDGIKNLQDEHDKIMKEKESFRESSNFFNEQISKINHDFNFSKSQTRNKVAKTSSHDKPQEDDSIMIQNLIDGIKNLQDEHDKIMKEKESFRESSNFFNEQISKINHDFNFSKPQTRNQGKNGKQLPPQEKDSIDRLNTGIASLKAQYEGLDEKCRNLERNLNETESERDKYKQYYEYLYVQVDGINNNYQFSTQQTSSKSRGSSSSGKSKEEIIENLKKGISSYYNDMNYYLKNFNLFKDEIKKNSNNCKFSSQQNKQRPRGNNAPTEEEAFIQNYTKNVSQLFNDYNKYKGISDMFTNKITNVIRKYNFSGSQSSPQYLAESLEKGVEELQRNLYFYHDAKVTLIEGINKNNAKFDSPQSNYKQKDEKQEINNTLKTLNNNVDEAIQKNKCTIEFINIINRDCRSFPKSINNINNCLSTLKKMDPMTSDGLQKICNYISRLNDQISFYKSSIKSVFEAQTKEKEFSEPSDFNRIDDQESKNNLRTLFNGIQSLKNCIHNFYTESNINENDSQNCLSSNYKQIANSNMLKELDYLFQKNAQSNIQCRSYQKIISIINENKKSNKDSTKKSEFYEYLNKLGKLNRDSAAQLDSIYKNNIDAYKQIYSYENAVSIIDENKKSANKSAKDQTLHENLNTIRAFNQGSSNKLESIYQNNIDANKQIYSYESAVSIIDENKKSANKSAKDQTLHENLNTIRAFNQGSSNKLESIYQNNIDANKQIYSYEDAISIIEDNKRSYKDSKQLEEFQNKLEILVHFNEKSVNKLYLIYYNNLIFNKQIVIFEKAISYVRSNEKSKEDTDNFNDYERNLTSIFDSFKGYISQYKDAKQSEITEDLDKSVKCFQKLIEVNEAKNLMESHIVEMFEKLQSEYDELNSHALSESFYENINAIISKFSKGSQPENGECGSCPTFYDISLHLNRIREHEKVIFEMLKKDKFKEIKYLASTNFIKELEDKEDPNIHDDELKNAYNKTGESILALVKEYRNFKNTVKQQREIINKQMILAKQENELQIERMKEIQEQEINCILEIISED